MTDKKRAGGKTGPPIGDALSRYTPELDCAERFLHSLDSSSERFTFQTFPEAQGATCGARVLHGTL
ncbi:MAG: hypothetical protein OSA45_17210, partial [Halioglobus sp.]|nr:hypothetical protein [Halioglobus sp.]